MGGEEAGRLRRLRQGQAPPLHRGERRRQGPNPRQVPSPRRGQPVAEGLEGLRGRRPGAGPGPLGGHRERPQLLGRPVREKELPTSHQDANLML